MPNSATASKPVLRHLTTAAIVVGALALYAAGAEGGGAAFVIAGVVLEFAFWRRLHPWNGRAPRRFDTPQQD